MLLDLSFVPFAVVVLLSGYRTRQLIHRYRAENSEFLKRVVCIEEFFQLVGDAVALCVGLAMCATWRAPMQALRLRALWRTYHVGDGPASAEEYGDALAAARREPFTQLMELLRDLPMMAGLPLALFTWRAAVFVPRVREEVQQVKGDWYMRPSFWWANVSCIVWEEATLAVGDVWTAALFAVLCFTWRARQAVSALKPSPFDVPNWYPTGGQTFADPGPRARVCIVGMKTLADVPYILAGLVVACTLFRLPVLLRRLCSAEVCSAGKRREACLEEAALVVVDLLLLPMAVVLALTMWRAGTSYRQYRKHAFASPPRPLDARWMVAVQFGLLLADLIATPMMLLVLLTFIRAPSLISNLAGSGKHFQKLWVTITPGPPTRLFAHYSMSIICLHTVTLLSSQRPQPSHRVCHLAAWRRATRFAVICMNEFRKLLVDIPVAIVAVVLVLVRACLPRACHGRARGALCH